MSKNIIARADTTINATAAEVWEALTTPEMIREYFFGTHAESTWNVGDPISFTGTYEGKGYRDKGTILRVEPNRLLQHTYWSSMSGLEDKPENYVSITYELTEENGQTNLEVTQENIPTEEMKEHAEENWKKVLSNMKQLLENKTVQATGL
jgi:uncharacterized protein YndB with AHSA1/START domain